jgi:hypothetical protein
MKLLVSLFVVGGSIFMLRMSHDKPCCDHQGNIYGNIKSMCSFWHINPETFNRRITDGKGTNEFDRVMKLPINFGNELEGTSVKAAEPYILELLDDMEKILEKHNIPLPNKEVLSHFEYDRDKPYVEGEKEPGWGAFENTKFLSVILK